MSTRHENKKNVESKYRYSYLIHVWLPHGLSKFFESNQFVFSYRRPNFEVKRMIRILQKLLHPQKFLLVQRVVFISRMMGMNNYRNSMQPSNNIPIKSTIIASLATSALRQTRQVVLVHLYTNHNSTLNYTTQIIA